MGLWREDIVELLGDGELICEAVQYRYALGLMERSGFPESNPYLLALREGLRVMELELARRGICLRADEDAPRA